MNGTALEGFHALFLTKLLASVLLIQMTKFEQCHDNNSIFNIRLRDILGQPNGVKEYQQFWHKLKVEMKGKALESELMQFYQEGIVGDMRSADMADEEIFEVFDEESEVFTMQKRAQSIADVIKLIDWKKRYKGTKGKGLGIDGWILEEIILISKYLAKKSEVSSMIKFMKIFGVACSKILLLCEDEGLQISFADANQFFNQLYQFSITFLDIFSKIESYLPYLLNCYGCLKSLSKRILIQDADDLSLVDSVTMLYLHIIERLKSLELKAEDHTIHLNCLMDIVWDSLSILVFSEDNRVELYERSQSEVPSILFESLLNRLSLCATRGLQFIPQAEDIQKGKEIFRNLFDAKDLILRSLPLIYFNRSLHKAFGQTLVLLQSVPIFTIQSKPFTHNEVIAKDLNDCCEECIGKSMQILSQKDIHSSIDFVKFFFTSPGDEKNVEPNLSSTNALIARSILLSHCIRSENSQPLLRKCFLTGVCKIFELLDQVPEAAFFLHHPSKPKVDDNDFFLILWRNLCTYLIHAKNQPRSKEYLTFLSILYQQLLQGKVSLNVNLVSEVIYFDCSNHSRFHLNTIAQGIRSASHNLYSVSMVDEDLSHQHYFRNNLYVLNSLIEVLQNKIRPEFFIQSFQLAEQIDGNQLELLLLSGLSDKALSSLLLPQFGYTLKQIFSMLLKKASERIKLIKCDISNEKELSQFECLIKAFSNLYHLENGEGSILELCQLCGDEIQSLKTFVDLVQILISTQKCPKDKTYIPFIQNELIRILQRSVYLQKNDFMLVEMHIQLIEVPKIQKILEKLRYLSQVNATLLIPSMNFIMECSDFKEDIIQRELTLMFQQASELSVSSRSEKWFPFVRHHVLSNFKQFSQSHFNSAINQQMETFDVKSQQIIYDFNNCIIKNQHPLQTIDSDKKQTILGKRVRIHDFKSNVKRKCINEGQASQSSIQKQLEVILDQSCFLAKDLIQEESQDVSILEGKIRKLKQILKLK